MRPLAIASKSRRKNQPLPAFIPLCLKRRARPVSRSESRCVAGRQYRLALHSVSACSCCFCSLAAIANGLICGGASIRSVSLSRTFDGKNLDARIIFIVPEFRSVPTGVSGFGAHLFAWFFQRD